MKLTVQPGVLAIDPPLTTARGRFGQRPTSRVVVHDAEGPAGVGEAAPLPGYSIDTLADCRQALAAVTGSGLDALAGEEAPQAIYDAVARLVPAELPAARFALETALLDRVARHRGQPLWQLLRADARGEAGDGPAPVRVSLAALLPSADANAALLRARVLFDQGVRTFKLKVGPLRATREQRATLAALREAFGGEVALRLDANGSFSPADLARTLADLSTFHPEFVEEPEAYPTAQTFASCPCPLALDESLARLDDARRGRLVRAARCRALVLKPGALGGFGRCLDLAGEASRSGVSVVVSHLLEGPVGWAACSQLALALSPGPAAGLWPMPHQGSVDGLPISKGQLYGGSAAGLGVPA